MCLLVPRGPSSLRVALPRRRKRLAELQQEAVKSKFGSVRSIKKEEWKAEVTGAGETFVLVHLYADKCAKFCGFFPLFFPSLSSFFGFPWLAQVPLRRSLSRALRFRPSMKICQRIHEQLLTVAGRFPKLKCLRIPAREAIPGYPDRNVPTLLLYHRSDPVDQLVGLAAIPADITPAGAPWCFLFFFPPDAPWQTSSGSSPATTPWSPTWSATRGGRRAAPARCASPAWPSSGATRTTATTTAEKAAGCCVGPLRCWLALSGRPQPPP